MRQYYRTIRCPIEGGELTPAIWEPDSTPRGTIVRIHRITASRLSWPLTTAARCRPDALLVATDTRSVLVVGNSMKGLPQVILRPVLSDCR